MKKFKLLLGIIILLCVSASLDLIFQRYESLNYRYSDGLYPVIPWGTEALVYLVLGVLLLLFAKVVLFQNTINKSFSAIFLIVLGVFVSFILTRPGYLLFTSIIRFPYALPKEIWSAKAIFFDIFLSRFCFTRNVSGLLMAIGLLGLLPKKAFVRSIE